MRELDYPKSNITLNSLLAETYHKKSPKVPWMGYNVIMLILKAIILLKVFSIILHPYKFIYETIIPFAFDFTYLVRV